MKPWLALKLYTLVAWLIGRLWLPIKLRWRGRVEPLYLHDIPSRFGQYPHPPTQGRVWLHAVSLGEVRAAAAFMQALRQHRPGVRLLLTHGTATGLEEGKKYLAPGDLQTWQPWDTPGCVRRFLDHHRPSMGVLFETEIWPNWVQECRRRSLPLYVVNARLNASSLRKALRLAPLSLPAYGGLSGVLAQSESDATHLRELGAPVLGVFGNLKFDVDPLPALRALGQQWRLLLAGRPVILLASSREGEEAEWLEALKRASVGIAHPLWLIVPRHPQRFDAVAELIQAAGLKLARRSSWVPGALPVEALQADVWLGDSTGEMHAYCSMSDVALMGGTFGVFGGQNPIDPLACGVPVLVGAHTYNFADIVQRAIEAGACQRVDDMLQAVQVALGLLNAPGHMETMSRHALSMVASGRGASDRQVQAVLNHYSSGSPG